MTKIKVNPLGTDAVSELIGDVVQCEATGDVAQLAQLVHQKTRGNPFFTIAFLTTLYQTGLLVPLPHPLSHISSLPHTHISIKHNHIISHRQLWSLVDMTSLHLVCAQTPHTHTPHTHSILTMASTSGDGTWRRSSPWASQTMSSSSWCKSWVGFPKRRSRCSTWRRSLGQSLTYEMWPRSVQ